MSYNLVTKVCSTDRESFRDDIFDKIEKYSKKRKFSVPFPAWCHFYFTDLLNVFINACF